MHQGTYLGYVVCQELVILGQRQGRHSGTPYGVITHNHERIHDHGKEVEGTGYRISNSGSLSCPSAAMVSVDDMQICTSLEVLPISITPLGRGLG